MCYFFFNDSANNEIYTYWHTLSRHDAPPISKGRNRRRIEAEAAWLALHEMQGLPVHVFRLAGIYGPGRSALDAVRAGRAKRIDKPGQLFSRIHVEDRKSTRLNSSH